MCWSNWNYDHVATSHTGADTELSKGEGILCKTHVQNIDHAHLQRAKN